MENPNLVTSVPARAPSGPRIAVVAHAYHLDLVPELLGYLDRFPFPFDLILTTPHADLMRAVGPWRGSAKLTVEVCENRGRDVAPFLQLLRAGALDGCDAVLKLHLKKSSYSEKGSTWRRALFDALCGGADVARGSLELLDRGDIGIVGPHVYFLTDPQFWGSNRGRLAEILRAAGALGDGEEPRLAFFAGSMFWCNPKALRGLRSVPEDLLLFEDELGQRDGTLAHALERAFCEVARHAGYVVTSLPLEGRDIHTTDTSANRVPVI